VAAQKRIPGSMRRRFKTIVICIALFLIQSTCCYAQYEVPDTTDLPEVVIGDEDEEDEVMVSDLREEDRKELEVRKVEQEKIDKLRNDDDFWYVKELKKKEKKEIKPQKQSWLGKLLNSNGFGTVMWIIVIAAFVGILVWFLTTMDGSIFRKQSKKIREDAEEEIPENIFEIDFEKAIAAAVSGGNFRLGVRLMYLQLLKELSEKNIIRYNPQRPNSEYVMQLYGTNYYQEFFSITRNFEYAWYGGFHVSPVAYEKIRSEVSGLKNRIA
jgi:hypothetical protein